MKYDLNSMKKALVVVLLTAGMIILSYFFSNDREMEFINDEIQELIDTDRAFSQLSIEKGMKHAFLTYFDTNGVLLKPNKNPIVGYKAIKSHVETGDDGSFTLRWIPLRGDVSKSFDLGYTYGKYELLNKSSQKIIEVGTYCSVWKKNDSDDWKLVLDTGNEGLE